MGCLAEIQFESYFKLTFGNSPPLGFFISSICKDVEEINYGINAVMT
jgi:hypothetical protein